MTIVEESFTDEVSDGGSIPPSSINDQETLKGLLVIYMKESNGKAETEGREEAPVARPSRSPA